jgi:Arc/MetJ-type ribon-helix-helix transcriptional regulator
MKVIPVRIDDKKLKNIDMLVKSGIYKSRSEALRKILEIGLEEIDEEIEYIKKIDKIVDKIIDSELNFDGALRKSLEEGRAS